MAQRKVYQTRRFVSTDLGNGKVITPIKNEFRRMEYEMALDGNVIGFAQSREQAEISLDEAASERDARLAADLADEAAERNAEPCHWCGGNGCKSAMQPAFCLDCVAAMLRGEDAPRKDMHRQPAEAWMCADCAEGDIAQRDPARPTHCVSCPVRTLLIETNARVVIVTALMDGVVQSRLPYTNDEHGRRLAERRADELRAAGYELAASPPIDPLPFYCPGCDRTMPRPACPDCGDRGMSAHRAADILAVDLGMLREAVDLNIPIGFLAARVRSAVFDWDEGLMQFPIAVQCDAALGVFGAQERRAA
jgi:hypothetical protein